MTNNEAPLFLVYRGKRRRAELTICKECSSTFLRRKSHSNGKNIYCSQICFKKDRFRSMQIEVSCRMCSKVFVKSNSKAANSRSGLHFCSRKCKDLGQRISSSIVEIQPSHYGDESQKYRNVAKQTRPFVCCDCGLKMESLLTVHHIDGVRSNNAPENLEVLCFTHHALRHLMQEEDGCWRLSYRDGLTPRHMIEKLLSSCIEMAV